MHLLWQVPTKSNMHSIKMIISTQHKKQFIGLYVPWKTAKIEHELVQVSDYKEAIVTTTGCEMKLRFMANK